MALATDVSADADRLVNQEIAFQKFGTPDGTKVRDLVTAGWTQAQAYAAHAIEAANTALTALQTAGQDAANIPPIDSTVATIADLTTKLDPFTGVIASHLVDLQFNDSDYSSPEFSHLLSQVDQWVQGAYTGLPPDIEQALWDRTRSREAVASNKKAQEAIRQFAARGFSKPPGALAVSLLEAAQEEQNNVVTSSRDIAIKQADLMQSNRRFAFELAEKIQATLIQYLKDKMQRLLDVKKTIAQVNAEYYGHDVQVYNAQSSFAGALLGAEAQVIRAHADIDIAQGNIRVEAAKANLQAAIQKVTILVEAIKGVAQISGQLAASALAAVNLSGGLHDSTSWGMSVGDNRSRSTSVSIGSQSNRQENFTP